MSAQPSDARPSQPAVHLPRTIRAVRAALDEESRVAFAAELDAGILATASARDVFGDRWAA